MKMSPLWTVLVVLVLDSACGDAMDPVPSVSSEEPPEGYYAFVESPSAVPPRVRPPPYRQIQSECPGVHNPKPHLRSHNLCGDLNRGLIPRNPMGQSPYGEPYPFELIRNQTLKFLSRTLPVLRADDTLPRVAQIQPTAEEALDNFSDNGIGRKSGDRKKRSAELEPSTDDIPSSQLAMEHRAVQTPRESRKFCDGGGVFCMLYRAINGESGATGANSPTTTVERREDPGSPNQGGPPRYEGPPTPCPAEVEYATPVFARNYEGVWRYVVQIPYEGYFTQTIEVTRCMQSRCHYLDGGCLSSPRWASLLVAELHYLDAVLSGPAAAGSPASRPHSPRPGSATGGPPPVHDFQNYQQYLQKRAGVQAGGAAGQSSTSDTSTTDKPPHCDGHDELGCFQVRLYYDWFLVPGSCKCWRPDYFARYVRRKSTGTEL